MKFPLPEGLDKFYPSQEQFIKDCTDHIKKGGVGIFASPTGTGKTISLLSSILTFSHKVYYSSKTYDQLNQSIKELKRFKETLHSNEAILLGSRGVYCVNKSINKNDLDKINDSCNKLIKKNGCEFYNKTEFKEIPGILCIEDMHKQAGCPYFVSKSQNKRITFLPYQMIFSKQSRLSYNIDLKNTIIVIDEAHNIFDTVVQMTTVVINYFLVKKILNFLSKKEVCSFRDFLLKILKKFVVFFKERKQNEETKKLKENENNLQNGFKKASNFNIKDLSRNIKECCMSVDQFNLLLGLENYNFFGLEEDAKDYSSNLEERSDFYQIIAFLVLLTFSDEGGRVFISEDSVKFVPLDPKIYFEELKEAKAVILAGGTMEPQKYYERVFGKVSYFSYDSVCKNLKVVLIPQSMKKIDLVLNLEKRVFFIKEVCEMISGLIAQCKKGNVVIFVPSSSFLNLVKETGIESEKMIFWDDKQFFKSQNSVLISIMGGRLSEGINFSDDMCRLLLIISIPFPSLSLELREKEKYFGSEYSTTQAMRTVNQTIGRAIRHKNDYAVAILIDFRYKFLKKYFSEWMKDIFYEKNYEEAKMFINDFYKKFD